MFVDEPPPGVHFFRDGDPRIDYFIIGLLLTNPGRGRLPRRGERDPKKAGGTQPLFLLEAEECGRGETDHPCNRVLLFAIDRGCCVYIRRKMPPPTHTRPSARSGRVVTAIPFAT